MAGIVRSPRPDRAYLEVHNSTARDRRLSYRARGVLVRLLSNKDGWRMTAEDLSTEGKEGRDAILAALRELRAAGYIRVEKHQDARGHWVTQTYVFDLAQPAAEVGFPDAGGPDAGGPDAGAPAVGGPVAKKKA